MKNHHVSPCLSVSELWICSLALFKKQSFFCGKHLNFGKAKPGSSKYQTQNPTFGEKAVALTSEEKVNQSIGSWCWQHGQTIFNWLVVSKIWMIFHNIWDNPCHWLIFFKMVETTNQSMIFRVYKNQEKTGVWKLGIAQYFPWFFCGLQASYCYGSHSPTSLTTKWCPKVKPPI